MKKIKISDKNLAQTVSGILKNEGLVIFPSDTVYGLLADATNEKAVEKLIAFKERPAGKAISIFVSNLKMAKEYVDTNTKQDTVLNRLFPGPFTAVLPSKHKTSKLLESETGTLGIRIPDYAPIAELFKFFRKPITATSANLSSKSPHYNLETLLDELSSKRENLIDLVVDAGELDHNKPSTVVDLTEGNLKILREGDITPTKKKIIITESPEATEKFGEEAVANIISDKKKNVAIIIEGELGVGKTVLVKGIGRKLGINNIISPSFVISYEYRTKNAVFPTFVHFDLYHISQEEELKHLGIADYLKPGNLLVFEWGEKAGGISDLLRKKLDLIYIKMEYLDKNKRRITYYENFGH